MHEELRISESSDPQRQGPSPLLTAACWYLQLESPVFVWSWIKPLAACQLRQPILLIRLNSLEYLPFPMVGPHNRCMALPQGPYCGAWEAKAQKLLLPTYTKHPRWILWQFQVGCWSTIFQMGIGNNCLYFPPWNLTSEKILPSVKVEQIQPFSFFLLQHSASYFSSYN